MKNDISSSLQVAAFWDGRLEYFSFFDKKRLMHCHRGCSSACQEMRPTHCQSPPDTLYDLLSWDTFNRNFGPAIYYLLFFVSSFGNAHFWVRIIRFVSTAFPSAINVYRYIPAANSFPEISTKTSPRSLTAIFFISLPSKL
jgi:hypothetical protein